MVAAVELAAEYIRDAGDSFAVEVIKADSATDPRIALEGVNRLIGEGAHVVIGAGASSISQAVIQELFDEKIPQCSPSNTAPTFTTQENATYYFRTVASDTAIATLLAEEVVERGGIRISILARAGDYGSASPACWQNVWPSLALSPTSPSTIPRPSPSAPRLGAFGLTTPTTSS